MTRHFVRWDCNPPRMLSRRRRLAVLAMALSCVLCQPSAAGPMPPMPFVLFCAPNEGPDESPFAPSPFPTPVLFPPSPKARSLQKRANLSHILAPPEFRRLNPIPTSAKTDIGRIQLCVPDPLPPCRGVALPQTL